MSTADLIEISFVNQALADLVERTNLALDILLINRGGDQIYCSCSEPGQRENKLIVEY